MDINSLDRFVQAQTLMYSVTLKEMQNGKKRSHWMWYMFPQLRGLGTSTMAHMYGISGLGEAKAYLAHPVLSGRLYELCGELLKHKDKTALETGNDESIYQNIFGRRACGGFSFTAPVAEQRKQCGILFETFSCFLPEP